MPKLSVLASSTQGRTRADDVVARLKEAIYLGILKPQERLPTEVDLAHQFGVAPMTVRDALAELRGLGLVETRRGRTGGSFVRAQGSARDEEMSEHLAELTLSQIRDLLDEQEAIGGQCARLAARRASDANVRKLFVLTDELRAARTPGEQVRADSRFHVELAVAAHSERLTRAEVRLQADVCGMLWLPLGEDTGVSRAVAEHHGIALAVARGDEEEARRLAEAHVRGSLARLTELHFLLTEEA